MNARPSDASLPDKDVLERRHCSFMANQCSHAPHAWTPSGASAWESAWCPGTDPSLEMTPGQTSPAPRPVVAAGHWVPCARAYETQHAGHYWKPDYLAATAAPAWCSGKVTGLIQVAAEPSDPVNHPAHYNSGAAKCSGCGQPIECIDVVETMLFNPGNAIKYIWRCEDKGQKRQDLLKARWYLDRELAALPEVPDGP